MSAIGHRRLIMTALFAALFTPTDAVAGEQMDSVKEICKEYDPTAFLCNLHWSFFAPIRMRFSYRNSAELQQALRISRLWCQAALADGERASYQIRRLDGYRYEIVEKADCPRPY